MSSRKSTDLVFIAPVGTETEFILFPVDNGHVSASASPLSIDIDRDFVTEKANTIHSELKQLGLVGDSSSSAGDTHTSPCINGGRLYLESAYVGSHFAALDAQLAPWLDEYIKCLEYASPEMLHADEAAWNFFAMSRELAKIASSVGARFDPTTTRYGANFSKGFHVNIGIARENPKGLDTESVSIELRDFIASLHAIVGDGGFDERGRPITSQRGYLTKSFAADGSVDQKMRSMFVRAGSRIAPEDFDRIEITCFEPPTDPRQAEAIIGCSQLAALLAINGKLPRPPAPPVKNNGLELIQQVSIGDNEDLTMWALSYQQIVLDAARQFLSESKVPYPYNESYTKAVNLWEQAIDEAHLALDGLHVDNPIAGWIYQRQEGRTRTFDVGVAQSDDHKVWQPPPSTRAFVRGTLVRIQNTFKEIAHRLADTVSSERLRAHIKNAAPDLGLSIDDWNTASFYMPGSNVATKLPANMVNSNGVTAEELVAMINRGLEPGFHIQARAISEPVDCVSSLPTGAIADMQMRAYISAAQQSMSRTQRFPLDSPPALD